MPHVKSKSFSTLPNFFPTDFHLPDSSLSRFPLLFLKLCRQYLSPTRFLFMTAHESLELDEHSAREVLA
ncbi:hypothetical protein ALC57_07619 [Trachymyrmex cornetzi]|uniref:Uncharacterized protein n=1 Tax=Trachymyrmex cornetzi TaxID=471704 RepID=A0A151J7T7_9HYME|nr:hypothetical protein ALC57_07619 [Trachymyrmex cornetzi]